MASSNVNLVIAGDSIGAGSISGADPWRDLNLGGTYTVKNHSFAGAYIGQQAGLNESAILKDFDPNSGTNWLVVQAGTNDLAQGATASVLYTGVQKLVQDGHAQGFKVVVATVLPRSDAVFAWSSADESARLAYNDTVRANAAGADAIADIAASPILGNAAAPGNAALYLDGLHPTASAVQAYLEPIYAAVFSSSTSSVPASQPSANPAPDTATAPDTTHDTGSAPADAATPAPTHTSDPGSTPVAGSAPADAATPAPTHTSDPVTTPASGSAPADAATPAPTHTSDPGTTPAVGSAPGTDTGSGTNTLVVHVSGDHYQGDPQFQVYVDGKAVGGTQAVTAVHGSNQWQDIALKGDFSPSSPHAVEVRFLNDAYDGSGQFSEGHDRNLYVSSVSLDGHSFGSSDANPTVLLQNGGVTIATTAATAASDGHSPGPSDTSAAVGTGGAAPTDVSGSHTPGPSDTSAAVGTGGAAPTDVSGSHTPSPGDTSAAVGTGDTAPAVGATTIGSGASHLVLKISQDAYVGDAQYTVSVDGQQIGGVQTAHASHAAGQSDTVTVKGDFGPGDHAVSVTFLNDFYGGSASTDRNLYVDGASNDGAAVANSALSLLYNGSLQFNVPGTSAGTSSGAGAAAATSAAPNVALAHDTGTGGTHATSDGLVTYAPAVSGDTLHYKLDSGPVTTTAPVLATDGSANGQHTVTVYETDAAGHTSADASLVFSLDAHHDNNGFHTA